MESELEPMDIILLLNNPSSLENLLNFLFSVKINNPSPFVPIAISLPVLTMHDTELEAKDAGSFFLYMWCSMSCGFSG